MTTEPGPQSIDELSDWLIDGAPGATGSPDVVARLTTALHASGIPVDRVVIFVTTLHPSVAGRWFMGAPNSTTQVGELAHRFLSTAAYVNSPIHAVIANRAEIHTRIAEPAARVYPIYEEIAAEGYTDYVGLPLVFTTGEVHAATFATKAERGFSAADVAALRRVMRPLARLAEILALRRVASTLLSTYVGHNSGDRILAGKIQRGDFETLRAVIWFSDMRGFTEMTSRASTREVIDTLNRVFECQVPAIEQFGGEVLKFMGDGLLAIFPLPEHGSAGDVADRAVAASRAAIAALAPFAPLRIGLALHVGDVAYGNIGGSNRLDFTAIGPAVNIAARLEALTGKLGRICVVSEQFATLTTCTTEEVGVFELKGVPAAVRVFAPLA